MMTDHAGIKLGKRAKRHDSRTLRLARYLTGAAQAQLPRPPASVDYTQGITDWGLMLNDQLGCCTIAAIGHAVQAWTVNALGREVTVPDSTILGYYEQWDGYDPAHPASDQGGVELDVLNAWRKNKFAGHALEAYVAIALDNPSTSVAGASRRQAQESGAASPGRSSTSAAAGAAINAPPVISNPSQSSGATSLPQIATAIWLFGGAYIGLELPITAQKQDVWDLPAELGSEDEPGSWGGHAVYLVAYDFRDSGLGSRGSGLGIRDSGTAIANSEFRILDSAHEPASSTSGCRQMPSECGNGTGAPSLEVRAPDSEPRVTYPGARVPDPENRVPNPVPRTLTCITWGKPKKMTLRWFEKYCSEAYALVSADWLESSGIAPSGFDLAALEKDLEAVTSESCRQTAA